MDIYTGIYKNHFNLSCCVTHLSQPFHPILIGCLQSASKEEIKFCLHSTAQAIPDYWKDNKIMSLFCSLHHNSCCTLYQTDGHLLQNKDVEPVANGCYKSMEPSDQGYWLCGEGFGGCPVGLLPHRQLQRWLLESW